MCADLEVVFWCGRVLLFFEFVVGAVICFVCVGVCVVALASFLLMLFGGSCFLGLSFAFHAARCSVGFSASPLGRPCFLGLPFAFSVEVEFVGLSASLLRLFFGFPLGR